MYCLGVYMYEYEATWLYNKVSIIFVFIFVFTNNISTKYIIGLAMPFYSFGENRIKLKDSYQLYFKIKLFICKQKKIL